MIFSDLCYGIQKEERRGGELYRQYLLECADDEVGELFCGPITSEGGVRFELRPSNGDSLRWECLDLAYERSELKCRIECAQLNWEFTLRIPYRMGEEIIELGTDTNRIKLIKQKTQLGWGPGSFRLVTVDGIEHSWSIAFDTSLVAMAEVILRILALGLLRKKNDSWILGASVASNLPTSDQQRLFILNATIRTFLLPNDFSSD